MSAATHNGRRYEYLTFGRTRDELAAALREYRTFCHAHPGEPASDYLGQTAKNMRSGIRSRLVAQRAVGSGSLLKPSATTAPRSGASNSGSVISRPGGSST